MASFDYITSQAKARALLLKFGAIAATVEYAEERDGNSTAPTIVVFDEANWENKDRDSGVQQLAYIPGDIEWSPHVDDRFIYTVPVNGTDSEQVRRITKVVALTPTTVPVLYTLTVQPDKRVSLTLQAKTTTSDAIGGQSIEWTDVTEVWADVLPSGGTERYRAERLEQTTNHKIVIPYVANVSTDHRLVSRSSDTPAVVERIFAIKSVVNLDEGDLKRLELSCVEGDPS